MLVLSRHVRDKIRFPALNVTVQVLGVQGRRVRLGIEAPPGVHVVRDELQALGTDGQGPVTPPAASAGGTGLCRLG
jgi:carbon storage regulator CsrA